jgi:peptidyl-prolyl cis-trans isomerase A (cyclophilin A)
MKTLHRLVILLLWAFATGTTLAGPLVIIHTSLGDIEVELYDKDKPITCQNFLKYVEGGYYNNTFLHRCPPDAVTGFSDFVLQGGQFTVINVGNQPTIFQIPSFAPIVDEFAVGTRYSNTYGTLAMAKLGGNTNSATSSWFINLANNSFLDAADTNNLFAVFGHVVRGTNILNNFIGRSYNNGGLGVLTSGLTTVPLNNYTGGNIQVSNLYFITMSIMAPQMKLLTNGTRQITWTSVNGLTNALEYATNLPPIWQTLSNNFGSGGVITNLDASTNKTGRFYRVRILY